MSSKNIYRIGGFAAIASILREIIIGFVPSDAIDNLISARLNFYIFDLLSYVLILLIFWTLYHLYASTNPRLSLAALILSVIGTVVLLMNGTPYIDFPHRIFIIVLMFNQIIPVLIFGILAYRHPRLGIPRILAVIGISYAAIWIVFYVLRNIFPDLNLGLVYNIPFVLNLVWLIWTGGILLSGKLEEISKNVNNGKLYYLIAGSAIATFLIALVIVLVNNAPATPILSTEGTAAETTIGTAKGSLIHANGLPFEAGEPVMASKYNDFAEKCIFDKDLMEKTVFTDETGSFVLSDLPAGKYCLLINSDSTMREILLSDNQTFFTFEITDTTIVDLGGIETGNLYIIE